MRKLFLLITLFLVSAGLARAAEFDFEAFSAEIMAMEETPGMAVAVIRPDAPPALYVYGVRQLGEKAPVDTHTLFGLASVSKGFTALALAMLADEDVVSWDAPVADYLPGFKVADPYVSAHATLRDLAAHRTGTEKGDLLWFANPQAEGAALVAQFAGLPQEKTFRHGLSYSNLMYAALGEVVRVKAGKSWEAIIRAKILKPLGMKDAVTDRSKALAARNAAGLHAFNGEKMTAFSIPDLPDNTAPAGGIYASISDISKWLQFWLAAEGKPALVSAEQFKELTSFQTLITERSPIDDFLNDADAPYGYALGWFVGDYRGRKVLTHLGGGDGVGALVSWMPEEGIGVAVLANAEGTLGRIVIRNAAFDDALGVGDTDWKAAFAELLALYRASLNEEAGKFESEAASGAGSSLPLEAYEGVYDGGAFGRIVVTYDRDGLTATIGDARRYALLPWAGDAFKLALENPSFSWPAPSLLRFKAQDGERPDALTFEAAGQSAAYRRLEK